MNKAIASLAAAGAIMYGTAACAGPEADPTANMEATLNAHGPKADQMWADGMDEMFEQVEAGDAELSYYPGDCATFAAPEGDVLLKNPGSFYFTQGEATIDFIVYADSEPNGDTVTYNGPYEYTHPDLGETALYMGDVMYMDDSITETVTTPITHSETDGKTAWIATPDGTRVSETIIVPYLEDGMSDLDALVAASEELCGMPLDVEQTPDSSTAPVYN